MTARLSLADTVKVEIRNVRGFDLIYEDFEPLIVGGERIPGLLINTFAATVQNLAEENSAVTSDWCVFSSYLPPLVRGTLTEGKYHGTILDHIRAVSGDTLSKLETYNRWFFPLYSEHEPYHWVLGWVDFIDQQAYIFDSIPELGSAFWAEPMMLDAIDAIMAILGKQRHQWSEWKPLEVLSPRESQRQVDAWSCGIFTMMGLWMVKEGRPVEDAEDDRKEEMRSKILEVLLGIPLSHLRPPSSITSIPYLTCVARSRTRAQHKMSRSNCHQAQLRKPRMPASRRDKAMDRKSITIKHKRSDDEDPDATDDEQPPKKRKAVKGDRSGYQNEEDRKKWLEEDPWVKSFTEDKVMCKGCNKAIKLDDKRKYDMKHWKSHLASCPQITGVSTKRVAIGAKSKFAKVRVEGTPSVANIFEKGSITNEVQPAVKTPCTHLNGKRYDAYIERTPTRSLGGISQEFEARVARRLLPWKPFPDMKKGNGDGRLRGVGSDVQSVPSSGNVRVKTEEWTRWERERVEQALRPWVRWEVDFLNRFIKSPRCEGVTTNQNSRCDQCHLVTKDKAFKNAVYRKDKELAKPDDEQRQILAQRTRFTGKSALPGFDSLKALSIFEDDVLFNLHRIAKEDNSYKFFLELYQHAAKGRLADHDTFSVICQVFVDKLKRSTSPNGKLKFGIRYPESYLNYMVLLRGFGANSRKQYELLRSHIEGPTLRHLRYLVTNSADALQNPYLIYENVARVRRYMDRIGYDGPIAAAGDCTKVKARLSYSTATGSHIIGSVLPMDECVVEDASDIENITDRVSEERALAKQVRAVLLQIPLPQTPPIVVALIPTDGKDTGEYIFELNQKLLKMAANLKIHIVSLASDGAASELLAQHLQDTTSGAPSSFSYAYAEFGIQISVPEIPDMGPVVSIQDCPHARKTARNQPQHGTHTASLGSSCLVNKSFLDLYETKSAGLVLRDVQNVDKQDDGAARRIFHGVALGATTVGEEDATSIKPGWEGLFTYLFMLGLLFDAWLNPFMNAKDRVACALRARFFLHYWKAHIDEMSKKYPDLYSSTRSFISPASFLIFNRLCDTLIILVLIYSKRYPNRPFCPWLLGTEFVEHFFGQARQLLPNFTFAEFLKFSQHVMVRLNILASGKFQIRKSERNSAVGYMMDTGTAKPLRAEDIPKANLSSSDIDVLVRITHTEVLAVFRDVLHIRTPTVQPIPLAPLASLKVSRKRAAAAAVAADGDELDTDVEDEDLQEASDDDDSTESSSGTLAESTAASTHDVARYAALCEDCDNNNEDVLSPDDRLQSSQTSVPTDEQPSMLEAVQPAVSSTTSSDMLDTDGRISIRKMVALRERLQAGTSTHSERVVQINPKFFPKLAELKANSETNSPTPSGSGVQLTVKEANHLVRIAQARDEGIQQQGQQKSARQLRWQAASSQIVKLITAKALECISTKNISQMVPLVPKSFVIMRTVKRMYIGEVIDIYKKGNSGRYDSIPVSTSAAELKYLSLRVYLHLTADSNDGDSDNDDDDGDEPLFTCRPRGPTQLYTHAPAENMLYHLGTLALLEGTSSHWRLAPYALRHWKALRLSRVQTVLKTVPCIKLRIPARPKKAKV
ncbi:hypothetical protein BDZ89DRAFT_1203567 [Hymenopellis radicata]|nr:hypothetical protein BDZ89DRAFT_1203567 [Hymenopellis radicata]